MADDLANARVIAADVNANRFADDGIGHARGAPADIPFQAARRSKLHDSVAAALGREIATSVIPEGGLLPTEADGVTRFGVSRTTYREAIRALAGKGLITSRAKTGTRVNPRRNWAVLDPQVIAWMFSAQPTERSVRALFELRMIVEPAAAALAAERRTAEQLLALGRAFQEMKEYGLRSERGRRADGRFHSLILEASDNEFLIGLTESTATAVRWTTKLKMEAALPQRNAIPLHFKVYSGIADRDPEAARAAAVSLLREARADTETLVR